MLFTTPAHSLVFSVSGLQWLQTLGILLHPLSHYRSGLSVSVLQKVVSMIKSSYPIKFVTRKYKYITQPE